MVNVVMSPSGRLGRLEREDGWSVRPVRLRRRRRSWASWIVGATALLMLLDGGASLLLPRKPSTAAPASIPEPPAPRADAWLDIPKPIQLYDLTGSPYAQLPSSYTARRRGDDRERRDTMTFGDFAGDRGYLRVAIDRHAGPAARGDLLVDLARFAATDGLAVTRLGLPLNMLTRFGLFDTADITLERGALSRPCLGYRLAAAGPLAMVGLVCGSAAHPLDRSTFDCVIDRIDLVSAGDDVALRDIFVAAERRRADGCGAARRPGEP